MSVLICARSRIGRMAAKKRRTPVRRLTAYPAFVFKGLQRPEPDYSFSANHSKSWKSLNHRSVRELLQNELGAFLRFR